MLLTQIQYVSHYALHSYFSAIPKGESTRFAIKVQQQGVHAFGDASQVVYLNISQREHLDFDVLI